MLQYHRHAVGDGADQPVGVHRHHDERVEWTVLAGFHVPDRCDTDRLTVIWRNYILLGFPIREFLAFVERAHDENTATVGERVTECGPCVDRLGARVDVVGPLRSTRWRRFRPAPTHEGYTPDVFRVQVQHARRPHRCDCFLSIVAVADALGAGRLQRLREVHHLAPRIHLGEFAAHGASLPRARQARVQTIMPGQTIAPSSAPPMLGYFVTYGNSPRRGTAVHQRVRQHEGQLYFSS